MARQFVESKLSSHTKGLQGELYANDSIIYVVPLAHTKQQWHEELRDPL